MSAAPDQTDVSIPDPPDSAGYQVFGWVCNGEERDKAINFNKYIKEKTDNEYAERDETNAVYVVMCMHWPGLRGLDIGTYPVSVERAARELQMGDPRWHEVQLSQR
ncbi:unnamed protein product [Peniophora sp. CBMAI 1063]|nr:unnamed protein product [Peniophora sp. CBMAI 1063]